MKLAILGEGSETSKQFVDYAKRQGFTVQISDRDFRVAITASHAVVCLPDIDLTPTKLDTIIECMDEQNIQRLIIASTSLAHNHLLQPILQSSTVDWTIVQSIGEAEQAIDESIKSGFLVGAKDLAKFLVNQITDSRYLQTTVLVKS